PASGNVLGEGLSMSKAVCTTDTRGVSLVSGGLSLLLADLRLAKSGGGGVLKTALAPLQDSYDCIILDLPPAFSLVTANGLIASDGYLLPTEPAFLSLEGVRALL